MERGLEHFTDGLSIVFRKMAKALKPGRPLVFTYHHNKLEAYFPVTVAILDAGLTCSAALPCPAEMGASIHISGTGSSIVDTVFVCRNTGTVPRSTLVETVEQFANLVSLDLDKLRTGGLKPAQGDLRCVIYGHLVRMTVWNMRGKWNALRSAQEKLAAVRQYVAALPHPERIEVAIPGTEIQERRFAVHEETEPYKVRSEEVVF
jgi:adenine-specific DNA methylase